jgi:hypothetical protein
LPRLPPQLIDDLLVDSEEVCLIPAAFSYTTLRGDAVAGAGFVVDREPYKPRLWDQVWKLRRRYMRVVRGRRHPATPAARSPPTRSRR